MAFLFFFFNSVVFKVDGPAGILLGPARAPFFVGGALTVGALRQRLMRQGAGGAVLPMQSGVW